jgi:dihydroflavonol-4-reductase
MQNIRGSELPENLPLLRDTILHVVDIWDCPRMHITVMNEPLTNGHRHMCSGAVGKCADVGLMIREQYGDQLGLNPSTQVMSTPVCVVI